MVFQQLLLSYPHQYFQLLQLEIETGNTPPPSMTKRVCTAHFSRTVAGGMRLHAVLQGHTSTLQQPAHQNQMQNQQKEEQTLVKVCAKMQLIERLT